MKNHYEALLVLNSQGKEDTIKEIIDRLESEFQKEGAQIEHVQKMDKHQFFIRGWTARRRILRELYLQCRSSADCKAAFETLNWKSRNLSAEFPAPGRKERKAGEKLAKAK